jgi:flagellar hook-associated protein 1 FlgK
MTDINSILGIGRMALLGQQAAIDITGRNIANADTEGYSRQRVTFSSLDSNYFSSNVAGVDIERIYDRYLEAQLNKALQASGQWESQQSGLERIEILFDESSGSGLSERLNAFWNAWLDLSNEASGEVERSQLLASSQDLCSLFNSLAVNLGQIQRDANAVIGDTIDSINQITGQVADLNGQIRQAELEGRYANTLQDTRAQLLRDLSSLVDMNTYENTDGTVSVTMGNGMLLVSNTDAFQLSTAVGVGSFQDDIVWLDSQGNASVITDQITSGELKGWLDIRDQTIPDIQTRLDSLAAGIIEEVNLLHASGIGLDGTQNDFFTGSSAMDMAVNQVIADDVDKIAAADATEGLPGGNSIALALADLQSSLVMDEGTTDFGQYYSSLVSDIGSALQTANTNMSYQADVTANLETYRESVSGVSLGEEIVNLVKYQNAFKAASQLINVADEMLETLMNII